MKLDTNGTNPKMLEQLFEKRLVDYVAMDIKHDLQEYETLTGRHVDIARYQKSIELIKAHAPDYEFRTTLIK